MADINLIEILIYSLNFLVTFVLLYLLLYKPVSKFLSDRKERISNSLKEAEKTKKEAEAILQEAKTELESTGERARQLSHEAIENAALDAEHILDNAQEEASAMIVRAREQMKFERQAALERAYTELVSLAGELASRIVSREVTIEDNRAIVDNFFNEKTKKDATGEGVANKTENDSQNNEGKKS